MKGVNRISLSTISVKDKTKFLNYCNNAMWLPKKKTDKKTTSGGTSKGDCVPMLLLGGWLHRSLA